ncbi:insulinase family protein [Neomegalonema sp.]|uniref:insulinase family protein n=1 Tax=Neomegalonema sp. TaxID=2039713 RepID=UPI0026091285|nr:insulinase family protein [Neomegalonema sp.]MDD2867767.1 insulinase family protein [Neomegalonema sp.]
MTPDSRNPDFEIVGEAILAEGRALRLRHRATGARILALETEGPESEFSISFPTSPGDDSGVAHVLEHMIFRGSRRFPCDQQFAELNAASMASHLNASTWADLTSYHFASPLAADLANLTEVCLDAVLHPLLREEAFAQEAWSLRRSERGPELTGVVFNEMRGHLADPEAWLALRLRAALFPETPCRWSSGGDPEAIPDLTLQALRGFHKATHHPSRALVFLSGPAPLAPRLAQIHAAFRSFAPCAPAPGLPLQAPFPAPRRFAETFSAPEPFAALGWVPRAMDPALARVLETLLFDLPDSPLRRIEVLTLGRTSGFSAELAQPAFTAILRGREARKAPEAAAARLAELADHMPDELLRAALAQTELKGRDLDAFPRKPAGLTRLGRILGFWAQGGDPLEALDASSGLRRLRAQPEACARALRRAIREDLLGNPHQATILLTPDPAQAERLAERLRRRAHDLAAVAPPAAPRPPEPASPCATPRLSLAQLPREIPQAQGSWEGRLLRAPPAEDGLLRIALGLDLGGLAPAQRDLAPILGLRLSTRAVKDHPAFALVRGFSAQPWAASDRNGRSAASLVLRLTTRPEEALQALDLLAEALGAPLPEEGIADLEQVERGRLKEQLQRLPHQLLDLRLRAGLSDGGALQDRLNGLGRLLAPKASEARLAGLDLLRLAPRLAVSGAAEAAPFRDFLARFAPVQAEPALAAPEPLAAHEGFVTPSPLNVVGLCADLTGLAPRGTQALGLRAIETGWLWPKLRVEGGAYSLRASLGREGIASLFSVRDPHLRRSLAVMRESGRWLESAADEEMTERLRIGALGALFMPRTPGDELLLRLQDRLLEASSGERRQEELDAVLSTRPADLRRFAQGLHEALAGGRVVVMGAEAGLRAALEEEPGLFTLRSIP